MNSAIKALEAIVKGIGGTDEPATVVAYVTAAIDALKIGDYAKAADLTAAVARVATLETKMETVNGGEDVDGSIAKALKDAKAYADGLAANYDVKGAADGALAAAKTYADGKDTAMNTRVTAVESALEVGTF